MSENKPPMKHKIKGIHINVWTNTKTNQITNKEEEYKTINIAKPYKNKDDEWKDSQSFYVNDIPKVILGLQKVYAEEMVSMPEEKGEINAP